jgi:hypothetical protein
MRTIQVLLDDQAPDTTITAKIDGTTVYSGPIDSDVNMFTFEVPINFNGQKDLAITVNTGLVRTIGARGNYTGMPNPVFTEEEQDIMYTPDTEFTREDLLNIKLPIFKNRANPPLTAEQLIILEDETSTLEEQDTVVKASNTAGSVTTGPTGFVMVNGLNNTFSSVEIDGVPQPNPPEPGSDDWVHMVYEGSTLTAKINIVLGIEEDTSFPFDLIPVL